MATKALLKIENLSHHFPAAGPHPTVLHQISFTVSEGELVALVGPSGGGKSTLLRIIAGLIKPTSGLVQSDFSKLALVFQNFALFPWLRVAANVEFGLLMEGRPRAERRRRAEEKIREVGLLGAERKFPKELSGGMRQRAGIARALAIEPDLLLLDEPFSSLDAFTAAALRQDVLRLWEKYHNTIIMVTHLVEEAVSMADRVIVLGSGPATILRTIPINLERPRNQRSPEFFKLVDEITALIVPAATNGK